MRIDKAIEKKMLDLTLEWYMEHRGICPMAQLDEALAGYTPREIVAMTHKGGFKVGGAYFYFIESDELVTLTRAELVKVFDRVDLDEYADEIEDYIIRRLLEA